MGIGYNGLEGTTSLTILLSTRFGWFLSLVRGLVHHYFFLLLFICLVTERIMEGIEEWERERGRVVIYYYHPLN
jgi:hypothetical protein